MKEKLYICDHVLKRYHQRTGKKITIRQLLKLSEIVFNNSKVVVDKTNDKAIVKRCGKQNLDFVFVKCGSNSYVLKTVLNSTWKNRIKLECLNNLKYEIRN